MPAPYATHRAQLKAILLAWGMPEENAEITADILSWADLHGVDSHGISMIPGYDGLRRRPRENGRAAGDRTETPVSALVDGGGGLGHVPAHFAMAWRSGRPEESGMAIAAVRNSAHFGAAGYYTLMAAREGLIGMACTRPPASRSRRHSASRRARHRSLVIRRAERATACRSCWTWRRRQSPPAGSATRRTRGCRRRGWVLEPRPAQQRSAGREKKGGFLTSLGGSPENSSYKGYGLSVMVNILASCLSGATLITDPMHTKKPQGMDIGHFFMAIDPGLFRDQGDFQKDVATFLGDLRATKAVDPAQPVMVAGDPQWKNAAKRMQEGIPVGPGLLNQVRQIAQASAAAWVLD